jgi:2-polyprenyl-3-methyl-5-hydroxy-6-metoxy-1,4-benzoquinol methylase
MFPYRYLKKFIGKLRGDNFIAAQTRQLSCEIASVNQKIDGIYQKMDESKQSGQGGTMSPHTLEESMSGPELQSTGERQVGKNLNGIEERHRLRYYFAAYWIDVIERYYQRQVRIADIGCGVGYGTSILASMLSQKAISVDAFDVSSEAIQFAQEYYANPKIQHHVLDCSVENLSRHKVFEKGKIDVITCFEFLEHVEMQKSCELLEFLLEKSDVLITSFPVDNPSPFHKIRISKSEIAQYYQSAISRCSVKKRITHSMAQDGRYYLYVIESK